LRTDHVPNWDRVLTFSGVAVSVVLFILPRSPITVLFGLVLTFVLLLHPLLTLAAYVGIRRWVPVVVLPAVLSLVAYEIWPSTRIHAPSAPEIAREVVKGLRTTPPTSSVHASVTTSTSKPSRPAISSASSPMPVSSSASSDPESKKKLARIEAKARSPQATISQSIVNSPGAVQAVGDVTVIAPPACHLTELSRQKLAAALHDAPMGVINIGCNVRGGDEPCDFARELAATLHNIGWRVSIGEAMGWGPPDVALCELCFVVHNPNSPVAQFGVPLEVGLRELGLNATHVFRDDASDTELRLDINALHRGQ